MVIGSRWSWGAAVAAVVFCVHADQGAHCRPWTPASLSLCSAAGGLCGTSCLRDASCPPNKCILSGDRQRWSCHTTSSSRQTQDATEDYPQSRRAIQVVRLWRSALGRRRSIDHRSAHPCVVTRFDEKPQMHEGWINGGFFVLEPEDLRLHPRRRFTGPREPLEGLASAGELNAFRHEGFWQCMDTLRDKIYLQGLWDRGEAPWKIWPASSRRLAPTPSS